MCDRLAFDRRKAEKRWMEVETAKNRPSIQASECMSEYDTTVVWYRTMQLEMCVYKLNKYNT